MTAATLSNLAIWSREAHRAALAFKRLNTKHLRGGHRSGGVGPMAVGTAAMDFEHAARKAARIALVLFSEMAGEKS